MGQDQEFITMILGRLIYSQTGTQVLRALRDATMQVAEADDYNLNALFSAARKSPLRAVSIPDEAVSDLLRCWHWCVATV